MKFLQTVKVIFICAIFVSANCAFRNVVSRNHREPASQIQLPKIFSDNMVFRQNATIPVWGTAAPNGKIIVQLGKLQRATVVRSDGTWRIDLPALPAGGAYELKIIGNDTLNFTNVTIGEVYVCSGQSNMEWTVFNSLNAANEIGNADYPDIRLITVERNLSSHPLTDINTSGWHPCSPQSIPYFSAVAYYFGRELYSELNVPIGLIHSSWGGTPIEAWTSYDALQKLPDFKDIVLPQNTTDNDQSMENYKRLMEQWNTAVDSLDAGLHRMGKKWYDPAYDIADWKTMELPSLWESQQIGDYDGIVWFRKEVTIPQSWTGKNLTLHLGPIDDLDITWFNGVEIGREEVYNKPRVYEIPDSLVMSGTNVIAVRVFDTGGLGGIWGSIEQMKINYNQTDSLSLAGAWRYKVALDTAAIPVKPTAPIRPNYEPTVLYNAMIAPLIPYAIRGAIWYQGESNASRAFQYRSLFPTMISDWHEQWKQGDFPFFFVQLANFRSLQQKPQESQWAELREAQTMTLSLPNTGMAVTIDIGDADDIHPKNKQDVGKRLALNALHLVHHKNVTYSGPLYKSMTIEGNSIRLFFDNVADGLIIKGDDTLKGFTIAGDDRKFHWADAVIDGHSIVVSCRDVPQPVAVRYAWADNPICNLFNNAGLPASPFRTDSWDGITVPKREKVLKN